MNQIFKKLWPHLSVIGVFLLVTIIYFFPQFTGKAFDQQHDILQWKGSAQEIIQFGKDHPGESTLWTNSMFGGMPSYQIFMEYSGNKAPHLSRLMVLYITNPAGSLFLMLLCFYILMLTFKVDKWLAILGSLAYAFSSYNFINLVAGHETKVLAVAFAPLVLAAVNLAFRGNWLWAFIMAILGIGMQLNANHLQITYYLLFIIGIWGIVELFLAIKQNRIKSFMIGCSGAIAGALIGVGLNLSNLLLTEEYSKYTIRAKSELTNKTVANEQTGGLDFDYATQWSNGVLEPLTILIPDVYGGGSTGELGKSTKSYKYMQQNGIPLENAKRMPTYHGTQPFTSGPIYFGAIICFFCILGLFIIKSPMKWALFGISILAFLLSMGKNMPELSHLFFDHFPLYNKFRAVTMMMVIGQICFPILALLSLKEIIYGDIPKEVLIKKIVYAISIVGGICAVFIVLPGIFLDFTSSSDSQFKDNQPFLQALMDDRESMTRTSAFRSLVFIGLSIGSIYLLISKKLKKETVIVVLGLLIVADLALIDVRYLNYSQFKKKTNSNEQAIAPSPADMQILADKELDYRVLSFDVSPFNDATVSYFHKNVGGYHGAKFRRYQELREAYMDQPIGMVQGNIQNIPATILLDTLQKMGQMEIFNMMNTKYFIANGQAVPNPYKYGNAWLVKNICWVKNADQEIDTLNGVNLRQTVVVSDSFKVRIGEVSENALDSSAQIKLTQYEPNHLIYSSLSNTDAVAVFSEIFYDKGWKITIDGKPVEQARANYVLRALKVPAGNHKIEFVFEPATFETGQTIAYLCSLILYLSLALGIFFTVKQTLKEESAVKK
jgi:hypothetical protein